MSDDLDTALAGLRPLLLDTGSLVRAVATGRRRSARPVHLRVELRPVDLRTGRHLQVVTTDGRSPLTRNYLPAEAAPTVEALLAQPFGNWNVETREKVIQLRVTKRGRAQVHVGRPSRRGVTTTAHDRPPRRLLDPDDPLFDVLGAGADKRRQVEAFLRALAPALPRLRERATARGELRVVDLGCGNAYLTFAAHRWLSGGPGEGPAPDGPPAGPEDAAGPQGLPVPVRTVGVDVRSDAAARNTELARRLGLDGLSFVAGAIAGHDPGEVDLVLALHACDTATDEALAVVARNRVPVVLAAPCCHHDLQCQLSARQREGPAAPSPYLPLLRHGILRERFADVLTDTLRAEILRMLGYRVEVIEFVESRHTPRNTLLRAYRTGALPDPARVAEYRDLVSGWGLTPALARMLVDDLAQVW